MKPIFVRVLLFLSFVAAAAVGVYAMTAHGGGMSESGGEVQCYAVFQANYSDRAITAWLRSPSGEVLNSGWNGHRETAFSVILTAASVGSGTYTCDAQFDEFGIEPPMTEEYDFQTYQLHVP